MNTFQELEPSELEQIEGGSAVIGLLVVAGAAAIVGAYLYGKSQGSQDCPFTPK